MTRAYVWIALLALSGLAIAAPLSGDSCACLRPSAKAAPLSGDSCASARASAPLSGDSVTLLQTSLSQHRLGGRHAGEAEQTAAVSATTVTINFTTVISNIANGEVTTLITNITTVITNITNSSGSAPTNGSGATPADRSSADPLSNVTTVATISNGSSAVPNNNSGTANASAASNTANAGTSQNVTTLIVDNTTPIGDAMPNITTVIANITTVIANIINGSASAPTNGSGSAPTNGSGAASTNWSWAVPSWGWAVPTDVSGNATPTVGVAPFARVRNRTHRVAVSNVTTVTNITNASGQSTNVTVITNVTHVDAVAVETVETASVSDIFSTYVVMFAPLIAAWVLLVNYDLYEDYGVALLILTLMTCKVAHHMVDQSLILATGSPVAVCAVQSAGALLFSGAWSVLPIGRRACGESEVDGAKEGEDEAGAPAPDLLRPLLLLWCVPAVLYAAEEICAHAVKQNMTLSEQGFFKNLAPLAALVVEPLIMPKEVRRPSLPTILTLGIMMLGSALFAVNYSGWQAGAVWMGVGMLLAIIPCRMAERYMLVKYDFLPTGPLVFYDSAVLLPSTALVILVQPGHLANVDVFWGFVQSCFDQESLFIMLLLSVVMFFLNHTLDLLVIRRTSATSLLVAHAVSNTVTLFLGVCFFGDGRRVDSYTAACGLGCAFFGGLLYALTVTSGSGLPRSASGLQPRSDPGGTRTGSSGQLADASAEPGPYARAPS